MVVSRKTRGPQKCSWAWVLQFVPMFRTPDIVLAIVYAMATIVFLPIVAFITFIVTVASATLGKRKLLYPERKRFTSVVITGGAGGIGEGLACELARQSAAVKEPLRLFLTDLNETRLREVKASCEQYGATVETAVIDVRNEEALKSWMLTMDDRFCIDCVIANAGVAVGTIGGETKSDEYCYRQLLDVNVKGVFNTVFPLLERMKARGKGQIALLGSLSGYAFFPGKFGSYSTTKAYINTFGESLRTDLEQYGVGVSTICPGFIESGMTITDREKRPMMVPTARACRMIVDGLRCNDAVISFPFPVTVLAHVLRAVPNSTRMMIYSLVSTFVRSAAAPAGPVVPPVAQSSISATRRKTS